MKQKLSNLEAYYKEKRESFPSVFPDLFQDLSIDDKEGIELSEGFRKFLIRGAWTKGLIIVCLVLVLILVVLGAIYLDSQR